MKIITALKRIKHIDRKIATYQERLQKHGSFLTSEGQTAEEAIAEATYNSTDLERMVQQINDLGLEKVKIRHALHKVNAETVVEFMGKKHTVDELLLMKKISIPLGIDTFNKFRRIEKGSWASKNVLAVLQYDPKKRDQSVERLQDIYAKLDELLDTLSMQLEIEI